MKDIATITINFTKARQQAAELESIAGKLENMAAQKLENSMFALRTGWTGENAEACLKKQEILKNKVSTTASQLRKAAETIRTVATNTFNAEMAAVAIAEQSTE